MSTSILLSWSVQGLRALSTSIDDPLDMDLINRSQWNFVLTLSREVSTQCLALYVGRGVAYGFASVW